ncbi:hypothetical protein [Streptomyces fractus]|uniref:hypothetical protein n=1 Tax=Streptomyces fractus TaxID=641806 RepID=UPI003CFAF545
MSLSASFHPTEETTIRCHTYGTERAPILALDDIGQFLSVSLFDSVPLAVQRAFAHDLVQTVAAYAAAVEEWATAKEISAADAAPVDLRKAG